MKSKHAKLLAVILVSAVAGTVVISRFGFLGAAVPGVSAVKTDHSLGIYWDAKCRHSQAVTSIDWGMLLPGEVRDVVVYVRNEGNETFVLACTPSNWSPDSASHYLSLILNCEDGKIEVGQVAEITLSLSVSESALDDCDFRFDLIFEGRESILGDINRDGSVNTLDLDLMAAAWGSTPTTSNWDPKADLDGNSVINIRDFCLVSANFGKSY